MSVFSSEDEYVNARGGGAVSSHSQPYHKDMREKEKFALMGTGNSG